MTADDTGCEAGKAARILSTPIGPLKVAVAGGFVVEMRLVSPEREGAETAASRSCQSAPQAEQAPPLLQEACRQIDEYFSRRRKTFQLPAKQAGTPFQQRVWQALQNIPYGQARSYQDIARAIGKPGATRAVGQANNRNKILILIPCHRVIQKDGRPGGFEFGVETKRWLLELEGVGIPPPAGLQDKPRSAACPASHPSSAGEEGAAEGKVDGEGIQGGS